MKILKRILIAFLILFILLIIALIVFLKTFDVNRFKPRIVEQAGKILNRKVDFEKAYLAFSFRQGINLKVDNFMIADDEAFSKEAFLKVKDVSLAVNVLAYLAKKEIRVSDVLINAPQVVIIRMKDGSLNVNSIAKPKPDEQKIKAPARPGAPAASPVLMVSSIKGYKGAVIYVDHSFEPVLRFEVPDIDFSLTNISLSKSFPFMIEAQIISAKKNIQLSGEAQLDMKTNEVVLTNLNSSADLSDILLEKIPAIFPMAKGVSLPQALQGELAISLPRLAAGPKGLSEFKADVMLHNGLVQLKELKAPLQRVELNVLITEHDARINALTAAIGDGTLKAQGEVNDYLSSQECSFEADARNLDLGQLLPEDNVSYQAEGLLTFKVKAKAEGLRPETLKNTLSGNADVELTKVKLKDVNVMRLVLDKIKVIPGLVEKIEESLPEKYKERFAEKDTAFSDMKLPLVIERGKAVVKDLSVGSQDFILKGNAEAGLDGVFAFEGSFVIPPELSAAITAEVQELEYLFDNEKQIFMPLKVSGKAAGKFAVKVDTEYIAKKLLGEQVKSQVFKALDKYLGSDDQPQTQQGQQSGGEAVPAAPPGNQPETKSSKDAVKEAVGNVLDKLLKQ